MSCSLQYEYQELKSNEWVPARERPAWGDASRTLEVTKDDLLPPDGWTWAKDWAVDKESVVASSSNLQVDELQQVERRLLGCANWAPAPAPNGPFLDALRKPLARLEDCLPPRGWEWDPSSVYSMWTADVERSCDNEGWTYGFETQLPAASASFASDVPSDTEATRAGGIAAMLEQVEREKDLLNLINSPFERLEHTLRLRRILRMRRRKVTPAKGLLEVCQQSQHTVSCLSSFSTCLYEYVLIHVFTVP